MQEKENDYNIPTSQELKDKNNREDISYLIVDKIPKESIINYQSKEIFCESPFSSSSSSNNNFDFELVKKESNYDEYNDKNKYNFSNNQDFVVEKVENIYDYNSLVKEEYFNKDYMVSLNYDYKYESNNENINNYSDFERLNIKDEKTDNNRESNSNCNISNNLNNLQRPSKEHCHTPTNKLNYMSNYFLDTSNSNDITNNTTNTIDTKEKESHKSSFARVSTNNETKNSASMLSEYLLNKGGETLISNKMTGLNNNFEVFNYNSNNYLVDKSLHLAICEECSVFPIRGKRYSCLNCKDIDFCHYCFKNLHEKEHKQHIFNCITKEKPRVFEFIRCDGCQIKPIIGFRHKCNICDDFDYCDKCFKANIGIHTHPFTTYS